MNAAQQPLKPRLLTNSAKERKKPQPRRSAPRGPEFLILGGNQAIPLSAVRGARRNVFWTVDGSRQIVAVTLELTHNREMTVRGREAEDVWKAIQSHKAGCLP